MSRAKVTLPPCGLFLGAGTYPMSADYLLCTLHGHMAWAVQTYRPLEMIERILADNQGNLAQVWGYARGYAPSMLAEWFYALDEIGVEVPPPDWEHGTYLKPEDCPELQTYAHRRGAGLLRFLQAAKEKGLYTTFLYTDSTPEWSARFQEMGEYYLGYDFGERYTFSLDNAALRGKNLDEVTLAMLADDLIARVKAHVDERHATGWGNVMATSSNFYIDYEIAAGTDIPVVEDFAFCHLNVSSALSRGLYRQHDLPMWGSHLAHEHYAWLPNKSGYRFELLKAALYQKYLTGSKMIINESGNWFVEVTLCEDSPRYNFPRVHLPHHRLRKEPQIFAPYIEEARKYYDTANYNAPECANYRRVISDFYDFVKAHGTPEGQPESTIAIAKGNYDLGCHRFMPNYAIAGVYTLADRNPAWFEGVPERGWDIVKNVFYPLKPVLGNYPNLFLSGSPYGMVDIVSFAKDMISADFLNAHYQALLFAGWNTASEAQYALLTQYVRNGGTLFIAIPHLSTNTRRNYSSYTVDELVHGGDFSELCGVKVRGQGERFYWATAPDNSAVLGFTFPRRFGIMATPMGNIEITDPSAEILVVDDEQAHPLLLRRRCGQGMVYFLNSWAYPGALNADDGPGGRVDSKGLIGMVYQHIARQCRGRVWITDDGQETGRECEYITFSYFPESGTVCLLNVDFAQPHRCYLHHFGAVEAVELAPGEFNMLRTQRSESQDALSRGAAR